MFLPSEKVRSGPSVRVLIPRGAEDLIIIYEVHYSRDYLRNFTTDYYPVEGRAVVSENFRP